MGIEISKLGFEEVQIPKAVRARDEEKEEQVDSWTAAAIFGLSDDIIAEILSRLPLESLVRFQLVSSDCRRLISSWYFSGTPGGIVADHCKNSAADRMCKRSYVPIHHGNNRQYRGNLPMLPPSIKQEEQMTYRLLGVSNGLLLYHLEKQLWYQDNLFSVYNPTTKQWIQLPPSSDRDHFYNAGIGFDPQSSLTQHFLVARFLKAGTYGNSGPSSVLELYSSQTNAWRQFETTLDAIGPGSLHDDARGYLFTDNAVFVDLGKYLSYLVRFDLQDESFQSIELPKIQLVLQAYEKGTLGKCNGDIVYGWNYTMHIHMWKLEAHQQGFRWILIHDASCESLGLQLCDQPYVGLNVEVHGFLADSEVMLVRMRSDIVGVGY